MAKEYDIRKITKEERQKEEWLKIPEFPRYQVSSMGRVRARLRLVRKGRRFIVKRPQVLRPGQVENGYLYVMLTHRDNDEPVKKYVHRLVIETFVGPMPEDKDEVDHINRNRTDNRLENLRFATKQENSDNRELAMLKGEDIGNSKLTTEEVLKMRGLRDGGMKTKDIAIQFPHVHIDTIRKILRGALWGHLEKSPDTNSDDPTFGEKS